MKKFFNKLWLGLKKLIATGKKKPKKSKKKKGSPKKK